MKIAIDASSTIPPRTGVGNYTYELIRHLSHLNTDVEYYLYFNYFRPSKTIPQFDKRFEKRINRLPARLQRVLHNNLHLPIELFVGTVDIFHSPNYFVPPSSGAKLVTTIHDLTFIKYPETMTKADCLYFQKHVKQSINRSAKIITVSSNSRDDLVELLGVEVDKITVVYEAAGSHFHRIDDTSVRNRVREKYGIPEEFILSVATLEPRKNLSTLMEAFCFLKKERDIQHKLVITGKKGWLYHDIFETARESGLDSSIIFTGFVDTEDMPVIYSMSSVFAFPSLYEGFGLPLLEAMSCGAPVVCSDTSSLPEVVGDAGILVEPTNVKAWVESLEKSLKDKDFVQILRSKGLQRSKLFSWEKAAKETFQVYKDVMHNP